MAGVGEGCPEDPASWGPWLEVVKGAGGKGTPPSPASGIRRRRSLHGLTNPPGLLFVKEGSQISSEARSQSALPHAPFAQGDKDHPSKAGAGTCYTSSVF